MNSCLPFPHLMKFFEITQMPWEFVGGAELIRAFGERVFFYEYSHGITYCLIQGTAL